MGKVYTRFQTKTAQKPYGLWGVTVYMAYIREYPPRRTVGPCGLVLSNCKVDKITPQFFIKTINKGCRVASQEMRCSSD